MGSFWSSAGRKLITAVLFIAHVSASCQVRDIDRTVSSKYRILKRLALPGHERGGRLSVDAPARRAYFARQTRITVFDIDSGQIAGDISHLQGVQNVSVVPELGRLFAPSGDNTISIFDLKSMHQTASIPVAGALWSNFAYDAADKRIFVLRRDQSIIAIRAAEGTVVGTLDLVDVAESAIADGKGYLNVVLADPAELAVIDSSKLVLKKRIQLAPCIEPRGVAMSQYARRVFVACSNGVLVVVDPDQTKVVARISVGRSAGEVVFDDDLNLVFTSGEKGSVAIVQQDFPDKYRLTRSIRTGLGASTLALDTATHRVLVAPVESAQTGKGLRDAAIEVVVLGYSSKMASAQ